MERRQTKTERHRLPADTEIKCSGLLILHNTVDGSQMIYTVFIHYNGAK